MNIELSVMKMLRDVNVVQKLFVVGENEAISFAKFSPNAKYVLFATLDK